MPDTPEDSQISRVVVERQLITAEELDERKQIVDQRPAEPFRKGGNGVTLQDPEYEKHMFQSVADIDCHSRVHLCHAVCCRLLLALTREPS